MDNDYQRACLENPTIIEKDLKLEEGDEDAEKFVGVIGFILKHLAEPHTPSIPVTAEAQKEMSNLMLEQVKNTFNTARELQQGVVDSTKQIESGFKYSTYMYIATFGLGVLFLIISVLFAAFRSESLLPLIFGGLSAIDFLWFFFENPPKNLQNSRSDLAQLQAALYNWFIDIYNWNSFLGQEAVTGKLTLDIVKETSKAVVENTGQFMGLVDKFCEDKGKRWRRAKS